MDGLIAIILVNYNGYSDTVECVKSIKKSDYKDYKIILVENGSNDSEIICKDVYLNNNADVLILEKNLGFAGGNNCGIEYAIEKYNPQYLMLINNDTIVEINTISCLIKGVKVYSNAGIITGRINYYFNKKIIWTARGKFSFKTGIADQPDMGKYDNGQYNNDSEITFASGCLMLIPRQVYEEVGGLDEDYFMYAEDTDYCCRVMKKGYKIYYIGEALIYHKVSASAGVHSDSQQYYMFRNNCYIIKKFCCHPWYGYLRWFYRIFKEVKKGCYKTETVRQAWKDFRHGIKGKI